ncbi:response regulator [Rhizobium johnstonii]|nr:response regulator [Rhizobium johnstonii]
MTLARLIERIDRAGIELDPMAILDCLWLASIGVDLALQPNEVSMENPGTTVSQMASRPRDPPTAISPAAAQEKSQIQSKTTPNEQSSGIDVYASGDGSGGGRRASPRGIAGAFPAFDGLGFTRALKPLRQRYPSNHQQVLDEDATAQISAEMSPIGHINLFPVTARLLEPWFEVHLIAEDDAAIDIWRDSLSSFANALRNSGAFRSVHEWRLTVEVNGENIPTLHAPGGGCVPASSLNGGARRLIFFASHGGARHWRSGRYGRLLAAWGERAAVALLHLLPAAAWGRAALGEASGVTSTSQSGSVNRELRFTPQWWLPDEPSKASLVLPLVEFSRDEVAAWAAMVMARGRTTPATRISVVAELSFDGSETIQSDDASIVRRTGMLLREDPKAFQLATILSESPFTIPVARLIQEAHFGRATHQGLAALFLSGILQTVPQQANQFRSTWFNIHPAAAQLLRRSLTSQGAEAVAQAIIKRVSDHVAAATGQRPELTSFFADDDGRFGLPDWAKPFAVVAERLASRSTERQEGKTLEQIISAINPFDLKQLVAISERDGVVETLSFADDVSALLLGRSVTRLGDTGERRFTVEARAVIKAIGARRPLLGARLLWVDDHPEYNRLLIDRFTFYGSTITTAESTSEALTKLGQAFDIVISDMARKEGEREGFLLIRELKLRNIETPILIFAAGFAASRGNRSRVVRAGAYLCTNDMDVLERHVLRLHRSPGMPADEVFEDDLSPRAAYVDHLRLVGYEFEPVHSLAADIWELSDCRVFLIGSWLCEMMDDLDLSERQLAFDHLLFADLAAFASARDEASFPTEPIQLFSSVMERLGWNVQSRPPVRRAFDLSREPLGHYLSGALARSFERDSVIDLMLPDLLEGIISHRDRPDMKRKFAGRGASEESHRLNVSFVENEGSHLCMSAVSIWIEGFSPFALSAASSIRHENVELTISATTYEIPIDEARKLQPLIAKRLSSSVAASIVGVKGPRAEMPLKR